MGRRRHSKRKKHRPPDPVDVLEGRVEVRLEQLFDLIHRVNPTDQGAVTQRGDPALRPQSPSAEPADPSLRRPAPDGEAKRARRHRPASPIAQAPRMLATRCSRSSTWTAGPGFSTDSTSKRRRTMEVRDRRSAPLGPQSLPARRRRLDPTASPEELLQSGQQALNDYDYEAAEHHLRLALERSGGGTKGCPAPARAPGRTPWEWTDTRSRSNRGSPPGHWHTPRCGARLALAAARLGDSERGS